jgi:hypothetical protein
MIIVNLYVPNISAHNFIKYTLLDLKPQINLNTVIERIISIICMSSRQKINKETLEFNDTIDQMDPTDAYSI